jgi:demethyllactenocin mycarosyltransferase
MKKKILFLVLPAAGHVTPSLALAEAPVARGVEVVYALPEPFAERVAYTGARVLRLGPAFAMEFALDLDRPQDEMEIQGLTPRLLEQIADALALLREVGLGSEPPRRQGRQETGK